ncbi:MAG: hypothetical protein HGB30_08850 [Holophagaceae bacterium]|nr:hypothetical protein [Holophagaceae bacterium]
MTRALLLVPVLLAGLVACGSGSPEAQVHAAFETCRTAVEAGDASAATGPLDPAFVGPEGMTKAAARLFLQSTFRQEKVGLTVLHDQIQVRGSEARQEVVLLLTSRGGGLLPQDTSRQGFRLRWRRVAGDWKLLELEALQP